MKKLLTLAMLLMAMLSAQAQVEEVGGFDFTKKKAEAQAEAERAKKEAEAEAAAAAAKEAAEKAEAARKEAAAKSVLTPEEERRLAAQQKKQREKDEARRARMLQEAQKDSVKWVKSREKLRTWNQKWAIGGQLAANWFVADNVTDHPPFRYFGDAINFGVEGYGIRFFSRVFGVRAGVGYHTFANRVDCETVDEAWHNNWNAKKPGAEPWVIYDGNGYYSSGVLDVFCDALFDVSGVKSASRFHPLHVYVTLGVGFLMSGEKKLRGTMHEEMFKRIPDEKDGRIRLWIPDKPGNVCESFESRIDTDTSSAFAARFGLLFDYRFSRQLSANFELNVNMTSNDRIDGIVYQEPFDIPIKIGAGLLYHF
ncbi:MAG: hypothetical protein J5616_07485 [Bacteroidaceae bacterium]|nr:hypothetical protein [Bacteroidaceae bacterium]